MRINRSTGLEIIGGTPEVTPGGMGLDLSRKDAPLRPVLVPAGSTYRVKANETVIVIDGPGPTTTIVLPPPGSGVYDVKVRNRAGGTVKIEPTGSTLEEVRTLYTMTTDSVWLQAVTDVRWFVVFAA